MIAGEGRTIYFSGDTDVMADMGVFEELHHPEIGILCAGGHFTMDMERAAFAARRFFDFETVIPCHYRTFPLLEQSAEKLVAGLPGVRVLTPEVRCESVGGLLAPLGEEGAQEREDFALGDAAPDLGLVVGLAVQRRPGRRARRRRTSGRRRRSRAGRGGRRRSRRRTWRRARA